MNTPKFIVNNLLNEGATFNLPNPFDSKIEDYFLCTGLVPSLVFRLGSDNGELIARK